MQGVSTRAVDDLVKAMGHGRLEEPGEPALRRDRRARASLPEPADRGGVALSLDRRHLREGARERADRLGGGHRRGRGQPRRPARGPRHGHRGLGGRDLLDRSFSASSSGAASRGSKLVVSDAHEGIKAAIARLPGATWQRCRVHFMRNALAHAGKSGRRVVSAFVATAFAQEDATAAKEQWRRVADQLRPKLPEARHPDGRGRGGRARLHALPRPAPRQAALHQPARAAERRDQAPHQVVGIFPNEAAITRLVGAILMEQHDEWAVQRRRYMPLESVESIGDDPIVSIQN